MRILIDEKLLHIYHGFKKNGTIYIGVTSNLIKRVYEHKNKLVDGFTNKYSIDNLVYYEITNEITTAIEREKQLKNWRRQWKINLIEKDNPEWKDLYNEILGVDSETSSE